ncbi:hypothetical protein AArcSl_1081 [Halalkaliarchaeum desulfuricum]|uniref:Uncharacterized protein n=1 Tax=Halalkaliarchaeum desulfuricum TaxID=2055893 RepID=A0A343THZ4_9EURY|nr:hypothetical protein [Halalkaliarchaeum desulfuricum]AUX08716.1 hypothetical protein AArcSl_1081 [Halalkaliarchaeum desulfuricum]
MSLHHGTPLAAERHDPPPGWPSLVSLLAVPVVLLALMWAMNYPLLAVSVLSIAVAVAVLLRRGGPRLLRRLYDRTRRLTIPGVGTVEYRITSP